MDKTQYVLLVGVFDLFHEGHLNLINNASEYGKVIVGVVKDEAIKIFKGSNRPIHNESFRLKLIKNLKVVYDAFLIENFDIEYLYNYLKEQCNINVTLAVRGEDQDHIKGFDSLLQKHRVPVLHTPRTEGVSTSGTVEKLING